MLLLLCSRITLLRSARCLLLCAHAKDDGGCLLLCAHAKDNGEHWVFNIFSIFSDSERYFWDFENL